jgi:hypothetical protein
VEVQEVKKLVLTSSTRGDRWSVEEGGGAEAAGEYTFFYRKGNENHKLVRSSFFCSQANHISS